MATFEVLRIEHRHGVQYGVRTVDSGRMKCPLECIVHAAKKANFVLSMDAAEHIYLAMYEDYCGRRDAQGGRSTPPMTVFVLDENAPPHTSGHWCRRGVGNDGPDHTLRVIVRFEKQEY